MTDQPERVDATGGGAPVPDAPPPPTTQAPGPAQPAPVPPAPSEGAWGSVPAAPSQGTWGQPAPAQPAPAQPAPTTWGQPAAAPVPAAPVPAQPSAPATWGQPAPAAPQAAWGAQPVAPVQPAAPATWGQPAPAAPVQPAPVGQPAWGTPPAAAPGAWGGAPAGYPPAGYPPAGAPPGWGGSPVAVPRPPRPRGTSGKTALAVLVVIIGVVFGANIVNAALPLPEEPSVVDPGPALPQEPAVPIETQAPTQPSQDPGVPTETSIPIETLPPIETAPPVDPGPVNPGAGVDVGAGFVIYPPNGWSAVGGDNGLTVFQKSGVLLIVGGVAWPGTPSDLAAQYRDAWFTGGQFQGDDPKAGQIGNGIPAAGLNYSGVVEGTQVDGAIIAGATNGAGVLFNLFGAQGSLNGVSDDLDLILNTVQYTGG